MKGVLIFLAVGLLTALGEVIEKHGVSVNLPSSDGWVFAGRTEIPEEKMEVWTARNLERRESIQFCVMSLNASAPSAQNQAIAGWERGLLADGRKEKVVARDMEVAGRKARYVVARWVGRDVPFCHFVMVADEGRWIFFSIVAPTNADLGGEASAKCIRSLHFDGQ